MQKNAYSNQKRQLWIFGFVFHSIKKKLVTHHGEPFAEEIVNQSRKNFQELLPQLPYVGGMKNYFSSIIIVNGWIIAMYKAMQEQGKTTEETIQIWAEAADDLFRKMPTWLAHLGGKMIMSKPVINGFRKQAYISQERKYPEDWVYSLLVGNGENFDIGFEFSECAVIKLYQKMDTMELAPYCNFFDVTYSHYLELGLDTSETLGIGSDTCRMLFKKGRDTLITPNLINIIPRANRQGN